jgi:hypothetical protein
LLGILAEIDNSMIQAQDVVVEGVDSEQVEREAQASGERKQW